MLAKKNVGAHGSRSTRTETLPASVLLDIVLPVYKERFTRWDGPLDSFRGESLSFRIRLSVMAIANFRIFSDSPPISDRSFSLLSFIDRASDKNLIPIQFGPRWCRFRRIKVWFMVVIIKRKAEGESVGLFAFRRLEACGVETARAFRTTEFHHALGVVSFRQISLLARRR